MDRRNVGQDKSDISVMKFIHERKVLVSFTQWKWGENIWPLIKQIINISLLIQESLRTLVWERKYLAQILASRFLCNRVFPQDCLFEMVYFEDEYRTFMWKKSQPGIVEGKESKITRNEHGKSLNMNICTFPTSKIIIELTFQSSLTLQFHLPIFTAHLKLCTSDCRNVTSHTTPI